MNVRLRLRSRIRRHPNLDFGGKYVLKKKFLRTGLAAVVAVLTMVGLSTPAHAYSSVNFYNGPAGCWGSVVWGGSSWYSGTVSYASTDEHNNPCFAVPVKAAVKNHWAGTWGPTQTAYYHVVSSQNGSNPSNWNNYGGWHKWGGPEGYS